MCLFTQEISADFQLETLASIFLRRLEKKNPVVIEQYACTNSKPGRWLFFPSIKSSFYSEALVCFAFFKRTSIYTSNCSDYYIMDFLVRSLQLVRRFLSFSLIIITITIIILAG